MQREKVFQWWDNPQAAYGVYRNMQLSYGEGQEGIKPFDQWVVEDYESFRQETVTMLDALKSSESLDEVQNKLK